VLTAVCLADLDVQKEAVKARFDRVLSWEAIGHRTTTEYRAIARA